MRPLIKPTTTKKHNQNKKRSTKIGYANDNNDNTNKRKRDINTDESPQHKKRKLNSNNTKTVEDRIHDLFARNRALTEEKKRYKTERDQFEKERNYYKQQMEHYKCYKQKYLNLKKLIISFKENENMNRSSNGNTINISQNENNHKNDNKNDKEEEDDDDIDLNINNIDSKNMNLMNPTNSDVIDNDRNIDIDLNRNNVKLSSDDEETKKCSLSDVTTEIVSKLSSNNNKYNNDETSKKQKKEKESKSLANDDNKCKWEDCHFVSVNCTFCGKHYDDFNLYTEHLKHHFDSDATKKWLKCNESGCDSTKKYTTASYMAHLCSHGHGKPFHCKVNKCNTSTSTKSNMVKHLAGSTHKINLKSSSKRFKEKSPKKIKKKAMKENVNTDSKNEKDYKWEDCHSVSVNCKFCGEHFDDIYKYIGHLKHHFDTDELKEWLKCNESECDAQSSSSVHFVSHLCTHGHQRPFHCKKKQLDGQLCQFSASTKYGLIQHLESNKHKLIIEKSKRGKQTKKRIKDDDDIDLKDESNDNKSQNNKCDK